jgi:hypothetical protein
MPRLDNYSNKIYNNGIKSYNLTKLATNVKPVLPRVAIGGARGAGINPSYVRSGGPQGALADAIQSLIFEPVKSGLQITNEYENKTNPVVNPVGTIMTSLFGKDWVARGVGNAAYAMDKYANTSPNKNPDNMKKLATSMASGEVTPMDAANVAAFVPGLGEAVGLGVNGLLRAGEAVIPKIPVLVPAAEKVGGGMSTFMPNADKLQNAVTNATNYVRRGYSPGAELNKATVSPITGERAEGVYTKEYKTARDQPGQIAKAINNDSAKRYAELFAGLKQRAGRGEQSAIVKPFIEEIKRIFKTENAAIKSTDITDNMGLKDLLDTSWYKDLSAAEKADPKIIQAHHYPGKDMATLSKIIKSYGTRDPMDVLREPKVQSFIRDMHKSMAYGSGESNRLARIAHDVATNKGIEINTPDEELTYMLELANDGHQTFAKYKGYTKEQLADAIGYPISWK